MISQKSITIAISTVALLFLAAAVLSRMGLFDSDEFQNTKSQAQIAHERHMGLDEQGQAAEAERRRLQEERLAGPCGELFLKADSTYNAISDAGRLFTHSGSDEIASALYQALECDKSDEWSINTLTHLLLAAGRYQECLDLRLQSVKHHETTIFDTIILVALHEELGSENKAREVLKPEYERIRQMFDAAELSETSLIDGSAFMLAQKAESRFGMHGERLPIHKQIGELSFKANLPDNVEPDPTVSAHIRSLYELSVSSNDSLVLQKGNRIAAR